MFSVLAVLLGVSLWLAPAAAQEWTQVSHTKPSSTHAVQHIAFVSDSVVICAAGPNLYRGSISSNSQVRWQTVGVGSNIYGIAVPVDNPFFVAYIKKDGSVGMRYTSDLRWRGGFTPTISNTWLKRIAASANGKYLAIGHDGNGNNYSWVSFHFVNSSDARTYFHQRLEKRDLFSVALNTVGSYMFVADTTLTFTVGSGAIRNYNGPAFNSGILVSAGAEPVLTETSTTDATLSISPSSVASPGIGDVLTFSLKHQKCQIIAFEHEFKTLRGIQNDLH